MIELKLKPRTLPDGRVMLELGLGFRALFGFLAAIVALGIGSTGQIGTVPAVVLAILVLGALYQEQWIIDPGDRTVTARHGLVVLARRRRWSFGEIERVEYTHYTAGSIPGSTQPPPPGAGDPQREAMSGFGRMNRALRRHFLRYSLVTRDGDRVKVEIRRVRDWNADVALPTSLAEAIGVPLNDTPL